MTSKQIIIKKGWNMISYPKEITISELSSQPENLNSDISHAWYWYPADNQQPSSYDEVIFCIPALFRCSITASTLLSKA